MQEGKIQKTYQAIIIGVPSWKSYDLRASIGFHPSSLIKLRRKVVENASFSHTKFEILQCLDSHSLVRCFLHTGRTHQIRVHLEHLGYPILGDKIYGQEDRYFLQFLRTGLSEELCKQFRFPRHALHAAEIQFPHPDGTHRVISSEMPADMASIIDGKKPHWEFNPK